MLTCHLVAIGLAAGAALAAFLALVWIMDTDVAARTGVMIAVTLALSISAFALVMIAPYTNSPTTVLSENKNSSPKAYVVRWNDALWQRILTLDEAKQAVGEEDEP